MFKHARVMVAAILVLGTATAASAQGSRVKSTPNSVKYKNTGAKPATGRSGSASLESRVLLAKNGTMQVEASTGSVEDGTGPGQIAKTQIKINGIARNFNNLTGGGYWTGTFPAVSRHTAVQVQSNVRGIDPKRTDVVTVSASAMLRPDVAVTAVSGPATHKPLLPATFVATVAELNGDLGARANCVLSIDGTAVDSADGIFVDANGTVACQFQHTFNAPGTHTVSVAATGVTPGDWDASNNSASMTIKVVEPSMAIKNGSMQAYQRDYISRYYNRSTAIGTHCWEYYWNNCHYTYENSYTEQFTSFYMNGWTPGGATPLQRVDAEIYTNGQLSHSSSLQPSYGWTNDYGNYQYHCRGYYNDFYDGQRWVYSADRFEMCSDNYVDNPEWGGTSVWYQFIAGDVVYYGQEQYCGQWGCNTYTWQNWSYRYGNGNHLGWTLGTQARMKLTYVTDSGQNVTLDKTVTIDQSQTWNDYENSSTWNDGYWEGLWFQKNLDRYFVGYLNWNDQ